MSWDTNGNGGTSPPNDFLGTTDDEPLVIKTGGDVAGAIIQRLQIDSGDPSVTTLRFYTTTFVGGRPGMTVPMIGPAQGKDSWDILATSNVLSINSQGGGAGLTAMTFLANGNVGIGNTNPGAKLDVAGDVHVIGNIHTSGNVTVDGNVNVVGDVVFFTGGADCAEDFDISGMEKIDAGTVMVLDRDGALQQSHQAYDKKVAGVISGAGGFKPAITLDKQQNSGKKRLPLALVGKVFCKVDAQYSPVEVGDLLTTSPTPGFAMKATDPLKAFGCVIGKALRPLENGRRLIPILVALQ